MTMMETHLPLNFPLDELIRESPADAQRLEQFAGRFVGQHGYGEGHFILVCYAAFPVVVTPDLLYKIWMNFGKYRPEGGERVHIHPVAVSDLLLSPLFTPLQEEIFRMAAPVRNACLRYLRDLQLNGNPRELHSLEELAYFLLHYLQRHYTAETPSAKAFREAQEWSALAYLRPSLAIHKLTEAFRENPEKQTSETRLRLALALAQLVEQERATLAEHDEKTFEAFATFSEGWLQFLAGNRLRAVENFRRAQGTLLKMPVPKIVRDSLREHPTPKDTRVHAILIAVDNYASGMKLTSCVKDAHDLEEYLESSHSLSSLTELFDQQATRQNILQSLEKTLSQAGPDDVVLIYFAGHAKNQPSSEKDPHPVGLVCHDFDQNDQSGILAEVDFAHVVQEQGRHNPNIVLILDTNAGTQRWLDMRNDKHVILAGSRLDQQAHELQIEGETKGVFTYSLIQALRKNGAAVSYRRLFRLVQPAVRSHVNQNPQLFGSPRATNRLFLSARNSEVPRLQELLKEAGYYEGPIDGHHGPQTAGAVERFRTDHRLPEQQDLLPALENKILVREADRLDVVLVGSSGLLKSFFENNVKGLARTRLEPIDLPELEASPSLSR